MIQTTPAIVINTLKFGDSDLIVSCYTQLQGMKAYLLRGVLKSKKGKLKKAYFQPLTQLIITGNHNNKGNLNTIREAEIQHFYESIHTDIKKQTIAIFISEIIYLSVREEEGNTALYRYLETSFLWLDVHEHIANFPIVFLMNLTKFLGFYPDFSEKEKMYFDLYEGKYSYQKTSFSVSGEKLFLFKTLLGTNFDASHKISLSAYQRQMLLQLLIQYFELHIGGFKKPKSLAVLKMIFN